MEQVPRKFILADIIETVSRRGWAHIPHNIAAETFNSDSEIKTFAAARNFAVQGHLSAGSLLFARKPRDA